MATGRIQAFDRAASTLRRHSKSPTVCDIKNQMICNGGRYNLLNGLKFLTLPGEWVVDSATGKVYFWPVTGSPNDVKMTAPVAYRLLELKGDALGKPTVHGIVIRGLTFTCTDRLPEDQWPDEWVKRQAELPDAMLFMQGVENCVVDSCTFTFSGSYAVAFQNFSQNNRVTRNEMGWLGCGGVLLQGFGPGKTDVNKNNVIQRNYIHHTGNGGYMHSAAVTLYQSNGNDISLNWLDSLPYAAIQIAGCHKKEFGPGHECQVWDSYGNNEAMYKPRWDELPQGKNTVFTRESIKPFLLSGNNKIRRNIVTNYMNKLGDGGALYCWGCGNGNVWEGNLLRRDKTRPGEQLCVALYMDDEVDGATLKDNICWHIGHATINKGANKWENNVIQPTKPAGYDARLAEITAEENQKKARALIQANQAAEVAVISKTQAVTAAEQKVEVAAKSQAEAETMKKIAQIKAETAEIDKKATIAAAEARKQEIELGGGLSEKEKILATIKADRDVKQATGNAAGTISGQPISEQDE